ncbi:hypothetical protein HK096_000263 [Nowakowskiella sp. JEL0078]|nr:hypothetical protein HK096_000263 [Nowakowskiella sp. JEL0078]
MTCPIHYAVKRRSLSTVQMLIESKYDVNERDHLSKTAIYYSQTPEIAMALIRAGAERRLPIESACELFCLGAKHDLEIVRYAVASNPTCLNVVLSNYSERGPLHLAILAASNSVEILEFLVSCGADPLLATGSLVGSALRENNFVAVSWLLERYPSLANSPIAHIRNLKLLPQFRSTGWSSGPILASNWFHSFVLAFVALVAATYDVYAVQEAFRNLLSEEWDLNDIHFSSYRKLLFDSYKNFYSTRIKISDIVLERPVLKRTRRFLFSQLSDIGLSNMASFKTQFRNLFERKLFLWVWKVKTGIWAPSEVQKFSLYEWKVW